MAKIAVIGAGYVGLGIACLLAQNHDVNIYDIDKLRLAKLAKKVSPIKDELIASFLAEKELKIHIFDTLIDAISDADFTIIATPTDYNENTNKFDTSSVEETISSIVKYNPNTNIIIKSTVPVKFTNLMIAKYNKDEIFFVPEFLREGKALYDNLYPSRIVVGIPCKDAKYVQIATKIAEILKNSAEKEDIPVLIIPNVAAEASKLFANAYLAMRVSFFNELDSYAETNNIDTKDIIDAVCLDDRIGNYYNNPSFGYGGYCLPKDSKQLKASFGDVPNNQISAIVDANETRKEYIVDQIIKRIKNYDLPIVGIYRLTMKKDSDNFRSSSIVDVMKILAQRMVNLIIYEPNIQEDNFQGIRVTNDLNYFKNMTAIIVANRIDKNLDDVQGKVYTRDIFNKD